MRRTLVDLLDGDGEPSVPIDRRLIIRCGRVDQELLDRRDERFVALLDGHRAVADAARLAGLALERAAAVAVVLLGFRLAVVIGRAAPAMRPSSPAGPPNDVPPKTVRPAGRRSGERWERDRTVR